MVRSFLLATEFTGHNPDTTAYLNYYGLTASPAE